MQEIRYTMILYSAENEKTILQKANNSCQRMLRQFGYRPGTIRQRYDAHIKQHYQINQNNLIFEHE
jgi:hypothetical protein